MAPFFFMSRVISSLWTKSYPSIPYRAPIGKGLTTKPTNSSEEEPIRYPIPPFTLETAKRKVQIAEDAWNTKDPEIVAKAYTADSQWRNRTEFFTGRQAIREFLRRKWAHELDYRLMKELWCFTDNRISVRFEYEWHDQQGQWYRTHGNEHWEFDQRGYMKRRDMSANDIPIQESQRKYV
ncbi:hypothetical protein GpartN1_g6270.t1 [Galdieria partita]|uniref:Uncharacterized protein n=1 Tax=Galdieria partita TaxID=83374 RepID=A0A9C7Q287_9RHOD|nr:hypothetical protein GpartN1_g6270.t1 [Galdieria partita]